MSDASPDPAAGAMHVTFGPVEIDVGQIGDARIKRMVYPAGTIWSRDVKPLAGTDRCEHAHGGFLVEGTMVFEYEDGCTKEFTAPAVVEVAPGHDGWVGNDGRAVLIEVDFEQETIPRLGLPDTHTHD